MAKKALFPSSPTQFVSELRADAPWARLMGKKIDFMQKKKKLVFHSFSIRWTSAQIVLLALSQGLKSAVDGDETLQDCSPFSRDDALGAIHHAGGREDSPLR